MSVFTLCFDCQTPITIPEALKTVMRQDDDGAVYVNVILNERGSFCEYNAAYDCNENPTLEEILHSTIVEDECGHCGINILINCDVCA